MDPQLAKFAQAIGQSAQASAGVTPFGAVPGMASSPQTISNIGRLFDSSYKLLGSNSAAGAAGKDASIKAQNEENAAEMARKKKADELETQISDLDQRRKDYTNPEKWKQIIKDDGGYDFFDPEGNQVDVRTYSKATNKHLDDVLKNSRNQKDVEFTNEYKFVQELGNAMQRNDKEAYKKLKEKYPAYWNKKMVDKTPEEYGTFESYAQAFKQSWPDFFANPGAGNVAPGGDRKFGKFKNQNFLSKLLGAFAGGG